MRNSEIQLNMNFIIAVKEYNYKTSFRKNFSHHNTVIKGSNVPVKMMFKGSNVPVKMMFIDFPLRIITQNKMLCLNIP